MIFGYFTLFVALVISAVAAYYSIVGLTAIFSAAVIPILIMGGSLEVGKVTAAVWLKMNWHRASITYKLYLVPAVAFLMLLTSMGIFGFLSKAHSDQSMVSGDSMAKVAIYDEKIKTAKDNIDANRRALKQMDEAVDQVMGRSADEKGAEKAVAIRRGQTKERTRLLSEIAAEQKTVTQLSEERAPLAAEFRKVEAEVGPIKYIAALVYGDNPDNSILEKAVRLVIIIIVAVFDPLALVLILAAQQSLRWAREEREEKKIEAIDTQAQEEHTPVEVNKDTQAEEVNPPEGEPELSFWEKHPYLLTPFSHFKDLTPMVWRPAKTDHTIMEDTAAIAIAEPATEEVAAVKQPVEIYAGNPNDFKEPWPEEEKAKLVEAMQDLFEQNKEAEPKILAAGIDEVERPGDYLTENEIAYLPDSDHLRYKGKSYGIESFKEQYPHLSAIADNHPSLGNSANVGFGTSFPLKPIKGDMFLRTDYLPSKLFKWNGSKWMDTDKSFTDSYVYNEEYIKHLIQKLDSGEYDPEDLTAAEQDQISEYLKSRG